MAQIDIEAKSVGIRFRHFHDAKSGRLIATIATRLLKEEEGFAEVSASICSRKDIPSKLRGKIIALGRMDNKSTVKIPRAELAKAIHERYILEYFSTKRFNLRPSKQRYPEIVKDDF